MSNIKTLAATIIVIVALTETGLAAAVTPLVITLPISAMTATERATYQNLKTSVARKSFLDTRGFLRLCQKVMSGKLPPKNLPIEPRDFKDRYITATEKKVVDGAIVENVAAILGGGETTPNKSAPPIAGGAVTKAPVVTLPISAMTATERATYRNLKTSAARKSFLDTRGYLRLCVEVKSGELPASDLPNEPHDFKKGYITFKENVIIDKALATHLSAMFNGIH